MTKVYGHTWETLKVELLWNNEGIQSDSGHFQMLKKLVHRPEMETQSVPLPKEMDVGHLHCLNCFFTHSVVLFLGVFLLVQAKLPEEIFGYLEETITLPSGADPSWNLIKTEWSVFTNNTWIATYRKGKTRTERVFQYKGRLSLNTVTGDLTIHNLTLDDAMEYTVDLLNSEGEDQVNTIMLIVKQVKSLGEVFGYLGHNITLSSEADPSWNLTEIEWSVFTNKTWIATYHSGKMSTELVSQYKGRLNLNITSGDLMIYNLTLYDAMDYRVHLLNSDESSFSSITLIVGLLIGILIILLLITLLFYSKLKDLCCDRRTPSETVTQDESHQNVYSSLVHGDDCVYETMRGSEDTGKDGPADEQ